VTAFVEIDHASVDVSPSKRILRDLSLTVDEGETVALIGRSGSGKTTALRLINALAMPTSGSVRVAGRETSEWDPIELRRRAGYVIQEIGLFPHLTVAENVGLLPKLEGWGAERIMLRVTELLGLVGLPAVSFGARRPRELSGGQRQRVGVARALAADPPLLLLDEPFGALDPVTRRELQDVFRAITQRLGKTCVFVTHDLVEATRVADRIALMAEGNVVATGTLTDLAMSRHPEAHAFLEAGDLPAASFTGMGSRGTF
jgi:osmoprotectant transport system ATP-binding protein